MFDFMFRTKDFYHTCYCLSGLSVAQHFSDGKHACTRVIGNKDINEMVGILFNFSVYCILTPQYCTWSFIQLSVRCFFVAVPFDKILVQYRMLIPGAVPKLNMPQLFVHRILHFCYCLNGWMNEQNRASRREHNRLFWKLVFWGSWLRRRYRSGGPTAIQAWRTCPLW